MRILVLGSTGMLGSMVLKMLRKESDWQVIGTQSEDPAAAGYFRVEEGGSGLIRLGVFKSAINCIGITAKNIDPGDASSVERATRVNATFPHRLAEYGQSIGMKVIHMSTDGVFLGSLGPYNEDSLTDCKDVYGTTKRDGELRDPNSITIRASIIGPSPIKKEGLWEWFRSQPDGGTINGYTNHIWNGITTLQFARLCEVIIRDDSFDSLRAESSLFHFAPNMPLSKYELLTLLKTALKKDIMIQPIEDPHGAVERILNTKYGGLKELFPFGNSIEQSIRELAHLA